MKSGECRRPCRWYFSQQPLRQSAAMAPLRSWLRPCHRFLAVAVTQETVQLRIGLSNNYCLMNFVCVAHQLIVQIICLGHRKLKKQRLCIFCMLRASYRTT